MIPTNGRLVAHYKTTTKDGTNLFSTAEVQAWDDNGYAMVVHETNGRLVRARDYRDGFTRVTAHDNDYITAVPGQGWAIVHTEEDGTTWTDPVVAFAIDRDGWGHAITGSADGLVEADDSPDGDKVRLTPPGGWVEVADTTTTEGADSP